MKTRDLLSGRIITFSNFLSLLRIILIPVFGYYLYCEHYSGSSAFTYRAITTLIAIALTDFLDGFLARTLNQVSRLGQFLDPMSDKITVLACGILLYVFKEFPLWVIATILIRDIIMIYGGYILFIKKDIQARPNIYGKCMIISLFISGLIYVYQPSPVLPLLYLQHISILIIMFFLVISTVIAFHSYSKLYHSTVPHSSLPADHNTNT